MQSIDMLNNDVISLTKALINRASITPDDAGCQTLMQDFLVQLGFNNETMVFEDTTNLWSRLGEDGPVFCFAGHTDVVPPGDEVQWEFPPFSATIKDGYLYGRGAADMKGSLAAMLLATKKFLQHVKQPKGSIAFLITSDEEGPFINGTTRVIDTLEARNEKIDYCIVGEPSSSNQVGDVVKIGRRGSISGNLTIQGKQGHVAYPEHVLNPIHLAMPILAKLSNEHWDNGNAYFPPTSFQLSNITSGTGATNVVPQSLNALFNLRYSTELTAKNIVKRCEDILNQSNIKYDIRWTFNGNPFITESGTLVNATQAAINQVTGNNAELSTSGGTSDGRFIAPTGAQVVELGPCNSTIHQINECVKCSDLEQLVDIYYQVLIEVLG